MDSITLHPDIEELIELLEPEQDHLKAKVKAESEFIALDDDDDDDADAGDSGDDDGDNDDDDDADEEAKKKAAAAKKKSGKQRRQSSRSSDDDDGDDDDDDSDDDDPPGQHLNPEQVKEYNRLKRERAEAEKKAKAEERKRAAEEGRHQDIISEVERERDEALAERDEAVEELQNYKEQVVTTAVARRLHFHDPDMAYGLLSEEDRSEDESIIEHALRQMAKKRPFLVDKRKRKQAQVGDNGGQKQTTEQSLRGAIRGVALSGRAREQEDDD